MVGSIYIAEAEAGEPWREAVESPPVRKCPPSCSSQVVGNLQTSAQIRFVKRCLYLDIEIIQTSLVFI